MINNLGNKKTMAQNIQFQMDLKNVSRMDVCDDLNIKYSTLSDWLNAKTYPRIDSIELLSNYFRIGKSDLVEEPEETVNDNELKIKGLDVSDMAIIEKFLKLNGEGREKAEERIDELLKLGYLEKNNQSEMVENDA